MNCCGDSRNSCNALYHYNKGETCLFLLFSGSCWRDWTTAMFLLQYRHNWIHCLMSPSQVCTDEEWSYSIDGLFYSGKKYLLNTTVCNIYIKTVLRNSIKVDSRRLHKWQASLFSAAPVCFTWHMLLTWRCLQVERSCMFQWKCHYYCIWTIPFFVLSPVSHLIENRNVNM